MATSSWLCAITMLAAGLFAQDDVASLTQRLRAKDTAARIEAADKLAKLGPKAAPAAKALGIMLGDAEKTVGEAAARALAKIGKAALPQMKAGLGERPAVVCALQAIELLGPDGAELVPDILTAIRQYGDHRVMEGAHKAVKAIGAPAVPALREGTKVRAVSGNAAQLLQDLRELAEPALPDLMAMITNKGESISSRSHAAHAIGAIGKVARKHAPALIQYALDEREHGSLREAALRAVGAIGTDDPKVVESVRSLLAVKDERLASFAKIVLEQLRRG